MRTELVLDALEDTPRASEDLLAALSDTFGQWAERDRLPDLDGGADLRVEHLTVEDLWYELLAAYHDVAAEAALPPLETMLAQVDLSDVASACRARLATLA